MKPPADNNKEGAESHKLESESKPIWKSMSMFLVPLLLSNVLQSVGQLFGMVVVGRWLGVNDLAAISAFFPLFFLLVSFVIGIGSGSSILIGQAFGAKNEDRLKAIVGTTLTFTFIIGVVLAIIGSIFAMDIMRLMGTPENIIEISVHYARILFISMPVLFLYFAYFNCKYSAKYDLITDSYFWMVRSSEIRCVWSGLCICYIYSYYVYCHACVFKEEKSPITTRWNG